MIPLHHEEITLEVGDLDAAVCARTRALPVFDPACAAFLDNLSKLVLTDPAACAFPDVSAFGAWTRRTTHARDEYPDAATRIGRGLAFHISSSNVPTMFAYTLVAGLLAGNANVVRLPSDPFPQVAYLCGCLSRLLEATEHRGLRGHVACVRYPREAIEITRALSAACDARVLWGGDATIAEIRKANLRPDVCELTFPDRESILLIDADAWLASHHKSDLARAFFTDVYATNQASCAAPRAVIWVGDQVDQARESFWGRVYDLVAARHEGSAVDAVRRLEFAYSLLGTRRATGVLDEHEPITRVRCDALSADLLDYHPGGGVFIESAVKNLWDIAPLLRRRCQTISYYGVSPDAVAALIFETGARGGHRIVPMGRTMDFSLFWDGHDMLRALSRRITIAEAPHVRSAAQAVC